MKKIILGFLFALIIHAGGGFLSINMVEAQGGARNYDIELTEEIGGSKNVKGETGVQLMMNYIGLIYKFAASLIGIVCVLIMVVSGVQIAMGGANNSFVSQAKERIIQSLFSLILLFGSYLVLRTVNPAFFSG